MKASTRIAVAVASLFLLAAYVTPLWRIQLVAPQYPEGLGLRIWVSQVTGLKPGDLNSINGLNHYIGMRAIEPDTIPELVLMPKLLGAAVVAGLLVALIGRRGPLYVLSLAFAAGSVADLYDFYRWGWDYGHHLDPHAAIKVPGMSYEPPLIGSKQLLNFHATSWPDVGGWVIIAAVLVIVTAAVLEWRRAAQRSALRPAAIIPAVRALQAEVLP
jgi:copper chaperone NosL